MPDARETTDYVSSETTKECPRCGKLNNASNKFCVKCRTPLPDIVSSTWQAVSCIPTGGLTIQSPTLSITDFLPQHSVSQTLRQIYFDLGTVLSQQYKCDKAAEAFQNALNTTVKDDEQPQIYDILMHLGYAYEKGNKDDLAFRTYIEAVFHEPEQARPVLSHARTLLTPDIILLQGKWVTSECIPRIVDTSIPAATRRDMALLVAYIYIYLANYEQAVEVLKQAVQIAPDDFPEAAADILAPDKLPPNLARYATDSNASYILASFYAAIGNTQQATAYIDHAFELLLNEGKTGKPLLDMGAYQLKAELLADAELLKADEKKEEAALRLFETAQQYYFKSEYKLAIALLHGANKLNPDYLSTYWLLADCLRIWSQEYPDALQESVEIWDKGYARLQRMDEDNSWAYCIRGLIYEQQSYLPDVQPWIAVWQAVCCAEQAMMYLAGRNGTTYAFLGRFYRNVSMERNALEATRKAVEFEGENVTALSERAVILANVGEFEQARTVTEKWYSLDPSASANVVKGCIAWYQDQPIEGLALLSKAVKQYPNAIWYRSMRGYFYRLHGDFERAAEDCNWVWRKFEEKGLADIANSGTYATSAYLLGKYAETLELLSKTSDTPFQSACYRYSLSGMSYLALSQLEPAEDDLNTSIALLANKRQIDDLLADLRDLETTSENWSHKEQVAVIIERVKERVQQRSSELEKPISPEEELIIIVEQAEQAVQSEQGIERPEQVEEAVDNREGTTVTVDRSDGWAWVAAKAGLARIFAEQKRWIDAAKAYHGLYIRAKERFPEARMGIEMAYDHLLDEMAGSLRENQLGTHFNEVLDATQHLFPLLQGDKQRSARIITQVGYLTLLSAGEKDINPADYFVTAFQLYRENNTPEPGKTVGRICGTLFHNISFYWQVDEIFKKFAEEKKTDERLHSDFLAAREGLSEYLDEYFQLKEQPAEPNTFVPVVTSLALEIGLDLIPPIAWQSEKEWNLFSEYIPTMRQRLKNEIGIEIPGIQVRDNLSLQPNEYAIYIDEVRVTQGKIPGGRPFSEDSTATDEPKMLYTPSSFEILEKSGIARDAVEEAVPPLTGEPGYWVPASYVEVLHNKGIEVWADPFVYIVAQLELVLRKNMSSLLGMQEVRSLLTVWNQNENDDEFIRTRLLDADGSFHFTRLLQALVRESIPITNLENIIAATQNLDLVHGTMDDTVRTVRDILKNQQTETQQATVSTEEKEETGGTQIGA